MNDGMTRCTQIACLHVYLKTQLAAATAAAVALPTIMHTVYYAAAAVATAVIGFLLRVSRSFSTKKNNHNPLQR